MNEYHVSCRVRSFVDGIDAKASEHADITVKGTSAVDALVFWLTSQDSYLVTTESAVKSLLECWRSGELGVGWDSCLDGDDLTNTDWESGEFHYEKGEVTLNGTACCGEFEFEVIVKKAPASLSREVVRFGSVVLFQDSDLTFIVQYGQEVVHGGLPYADAAKCFGEKVFHELACNGRLDNSEVSGGAD